jgi:putative transposase
MSSEQAEPIYPSDLSVEAWDILAPLLPVNQGQGRPLELALRAILNAILYVVRTGCQWRSLPKDYPKWSSIYYHFRKWCKDGTWEQINTALRRLERQQFGRDAEPTAGCIDTQSVKTTEAGGERGYDAGKKINGRKRHIAVDTRGNLLKVIVHSAGIQDYHGAKLLLAQLLELVPTLEKLWADGIYKNGGLVQWVYDTLQIVLEIVNREPGQVGFKVLPRRWVVERTFAWLGRYRRLSKDYEHLTECSEGIIYVASIGTMLNRIAHATS